MSLYIMLAIATPALGYLCWSDFRRRELPNKVTLGLLGVVLAWRLGDHGVPMFLDGLYGCLAGGLFLLIPFMLKMAGGGDLKMLSACGAVVGIGQIPVLLFFMSLCGLLLVTVLIFSRTLSYARLKHYALCLFWWNYDRREGRKRLPSIHSDENQVPFGIAIAAGTWLTLALQIIQEEALP